MLEALACGTRVVATATAGAQEAHEYFDDDLRLTPVEAPEAPGCGGGARAGNVPEGE